MIMRKVNALDVKNVALKKSYERKVNIMRIEYKGTVLEQVLNIHKTRPIKFVYLKPSEYREGLADAEEKGILSRCDMYWFSIKNCEIVFYLD